MLLEEVLHSYIVEECEKHISRFHGYHNALHVDWIRDNRRASPAPPKTIKTPDYWAISRGFNPFYVRRKAKSFAKAIAKKIQESRYSPNEPHIKYIPKSDGKTRKLVIYELADAAVSRYFYKRLLQKNRHRFSGFSYAYRSDKNIQFAIQDIAVDLNERQRIFVAEFDFSDFFGSISHKYLYEQFDANGFFVNEVDKSVIQSFLDSCGKGIPQGTSISLFLANLVCWRLDRSFENIGVKFARYADDTVLWSDSYNSICSAFNALDDFSRSAGVRINSAKSDGINLLTMPSLRSEMRSKTSFDFLGYSLGISVVSIKPKVILKIKKQISYLLYRNLIQPLKLTPLRSVTIPSGGRDEALLTAMMQIRRYICGGLLKRHLGQYLSSSDGFLRCKGIMSFYPLVTDVPQLRELDGWLVSVIYRAVRFRGVLLEKKRFPRWHAFPFNVSRDDLVSEFDRRRISGLPLLEVPSFVLSQKAIQKALRDHGIEGVLRKKSERYGYSD